MEAGQLVPSGVDGVAAVAVIETAIAVAGAVFVAIAVAAVAAGSP